MLGLGDSAVTAAFLLCIAGAALCTVYGLVNWNKGNENEAAEINEELTWQAEESQIDENL